MKIYADIVFLINLIMDIFILWIVSIVTKKNIQFYKIIFGGFVMSILYCVLIFTSTFKQHINVIFATLILVIAIYITFKPTTFKEFFYFISFAYLSSFAVGGIGMAIFFYTNIETVLGNITNFTVENLSFKILISTTCGSYILVKIIVKWYKSVFIKQQVFLQIKIFFQNNSTTVNALVDTGNSLCDPISKIPVIIVEFNTIKHFLSDDIKVAFYEKRELELNFITDDSDDFINRIRMIPFISLGEQNGMLIGFRVDRVEIVNGNESKYLNDTIIGIYNNKLCQNDRYHALLNPDMLD
jgi:stage II sporulation protein GA (sporulation sigma-E factor processing peptidase)